MSSITTYPDAFFPVRGGCGRFTLQGSGNEDDNTGYQVFFDGNALTEIEEVGQGTINVSPDRMVDIARLFRPKIPVLGATAAYEDDEAVKEVYIKYGDITYDQDNCTSQVNVNTDSDTRKIVNATVQDWEADIFAANTVEALTYRPLVMNMCRNQYEYISIFSPGGSGTVSVVRIDGNGTETGTVVSLNEGITVIPIGGKNHVGGVSLANIVRVEVRVYTGKTFKYFVKDGCCPPDLGQIVFFEPNGGWAVLKGCPASANIDSSGVEICTEIPCGISGTDRFLYGKQPVSMSGQMNVNIEVEVPPRPDWAFYLSSFKMSRHRYIVRETLTGDQLVKLNIGSGGIRIFEKEKVLKAVVSGTIDWVG